MEEIPNVDRIPVLELSADEERLLEEDPTRLGFVVKDILKAHDITLNQGGVPMRVGGEVRYYNSDEDDLGTWLVSAPGESDEAFLKRIRG